MSLADRDRIDVVLGDPADGVEPSALSPISGTMHFDDSGACFVPRHPFLPGTPVTVVAAAGHAEVVVLSTVYPDNTSAATTSVVGIHPTVGEIPRNQLKLYLEFSARMAEGSVATRVSICRADTGAPIDAALLPMDPELWDAERRRVTVLFDPARLKRGLAAHREIGYPLQIGDVIDVVVDPEFRDATNRPLVERTTRRYVVGPDVRTLVRPADWLVSIPDAGTLEPLTVRFDRPLDHALLQHCLHVVDRRASTIRGRTSISIDDRVWSFTPHTSWTAHEHALVVRSMLEDLAGNSVSRVFDRDLDVDDHAPLDVDSVSLTFTPRDRDAALDEAFRS